MQLAVENWIFVLLMLRVVEIENSQQVKLIIFIIQLYYHFVHKR